MTDFPSLLLAAFAYALLSTGYVLQKKGIGWIGASRKWDRAYKGNLAVWILGFLLMNLYIVPNAVALRLLEPHIVAALAGWGVIVLVFLSALLLKEHIYASDIWFTLLIVLAIACLNLLEVPAEGQAARPGPLLAALALPFVLLCPALFRSVPRRTRALLFACVSGLSAGMIIVTIKILVAAHGFRVAAYIASPYLYAYLVFSLTAFLTLQMSYKLGSMMLVGPVQYTAALIYPAVCSVLVFSNVMSGWQWAALGLSVAGVTGILRRHPRSDSQPE
jgi:drug/metabolite transporter (DMT)-like permease